MPDLPTLSHPPTLPIFPALPGIPNPLDQLGQDLGARMASLVASAFEAAMKSLWDFALTLLTGVLGVIDHLTTPNLDPRTGPLATVLPATLWVGAVLLVALSLIQIGKAALSGGAGLAHLLTGVAQYLIVSATALGVLTTLVTAANAAALGILSAGLHARSWQAISVTNTAWQNGVAGVSGVGLGLIALLGVLPAAVGLLVAALVREASILVIAATIPILAAGLVAEATARWFWTGLRWLLALIMLTPAVAIVLALGLQLAAGAANPTGVTAAASSDTGQQAVTAFVGAAVLLVSVFCPLALFKLFAFIDPGTPSGQRLRTSFSGTGTTASAPAGTSGTRASGTGASGTGASGTGASGSGGAATSQENDASEQVDARWAGAVGKLSAAHAAMSSGAQSSMSAAGPVLSAVGVGAGADPHERGAGGGRGQRANAARPDSRDQAGDTSSTPDEDPTTAAPQVEPPAPPDLPGPENPGPGSNGPGSSGPGAGGSPGKSPTPAGGPGPQGGGGGGAAASEAAVVA